MVAYRDELIERTLGGRYRLVDAVGAGASATVYLAEDRQLVRPVAVKVLHRGLADDPSFLRRFRAEAQAAAALSHPNILAVFDWGEDGVPGAGGLPYLVTEYLGGGSLRAMLDRGRRLTPSQALIVGLETARGLDYAHKRGVVHRDIKPANLLFGDDGRLRIADFGLARAIAEATWTEPAGVVLGTARYASPEQAKGQPVDGKTDVYSLVLTLVEAVTGTVPFAGETTVATLMNRLDKLLPVSAELSHLAPVLERGGRPWPDERSDANELLRGLIYAAERLPRPAPLPLVHASVLTADRAAGGAGLGARLDPVAPVAPTDVAGRTAIVPGGGPPPVAGAMAAGASSALVSNDVDGLRLSTDAPPPSDSNAAPALADGTPSGGGRNRGRRLALWLTLAVVAGLAAVAVAVLSTRPPKRYVVDNYVGQQIGNVRNQVETQYGWNVVSKPGTSDQYDVDIVMEQTPGGGATLRRGDTLELVVSAGAPLRPLPEVSGKTKDEATKSLETAGLKVTFADPEYDETMEEGRVLRWTVADQAIAANTPINKGAEVTVVLSNGPKPRARPSLKDMTWEQASAALAAVQLVPNKLPEEYSDSVPVGIVARADPPIGAPVPRGGTVNIAISKGPELFAVPDLKGHTQEEAAKLLADANLKAGKIDGTLGNVVGQSPAAGQMVSRGTKVDLTFG